MHLSEQNIPLGLWGYFKRKKKWKIPKDLITQSSESLVCLAVYDQQLHIGLEKTKDY